MSSLTLTIGLPGSGKTTWAKKIRQEHPNTVLVSRDALREEFFGEFTNHSQEQESLITSVAEKAVDKALSEGRHVIVHDMNLKKAYRKRWATYAVKYDVPLRYIDMTHVPVEHCITRVQTRYDLGGRWVDPEVILNLYKRYLSNKMPVETPESLTEALKDTVQGHDPVEWIPGLPEAIIVDIDGTVADHTGIRDPYDTSRYHLDNPNEPVIRAVQEEAYKLNRKILFVSGRDDKFWTVTYEWLMEHVKVPVEILAMRPMGDTRRDDIIKLELFDNHIRGKYNIAKVYDDRNRVVKAWRSINLPVFQVDEGDF